MKILYISRAVMPSTTSNSLSIIRMAQALADANHEVILTHIAPESAEDSEIHAYYGTTGGFQLVAHRLFSSSYLSALAKTIQRYLVSPIVNRRRVKREKPDLVYSRLTLPELVLLPRTTHLVYEMHSPNYLGGFGITRRFFVRTLRSFRQLKFVVTTRALEALVKEAFPSSEIVRAPLSADLPLSRTEQAALTNPLRQCGRLGCIGDVGYTGFVDTSDLRGIGTILELAELMPDVCFHIVGGGSEEAVAFWNSTAERKSVTLNTHF